jgi:hypothetical protein
MFPVQTMMAINLFIMKIRIHRQIISMVRIFMRGTVLKIINMWCPNIITQKRIRLKPLRRIFFIFI